MAAPRVSAAGGFAAMKYVLAKGRDVGSLALYRKMRSANACKTCALGMGGQEGGMVNEVGHFPEVCKKSVQAQAADMGRVIDEETLRSTSLAELESFTSAQFEALGRLTFPIIATSGDTHFRRATWDEAIALAADGLRTSAPSETFWYSSGRSSNEAAFLLQLIARAFGTNNVNNCSFYCHQASGVALNAVYGSGTASVVLEDLAETDLVVLAGANPASNHPRLMTQLIHLRRRGGRVVVINPLVELGLKRFRLPSDARSLMFGSDISDLYLQPKVGGDIALLSALLKGVIETGGVDQSFVEHHVEDWDALTEYVSQIPWRDLIEQSGVSRTDIDTCVEYLNQSQSAIFMWAMGLTHHAHGTDNVLALSNLALARGFLGKAGSGLMPIRGHSNVQGVGSVGVAPQMKQAFAQELHSRYGVDPTMPAGLDTYSCMVAAHEGRVSAAVMLGGNLWASNPDSAWATDALQRINTTVALTTKLNPGHVLGRGKTMVILPVLARDEESQATTQESMFNYVRYSDGGEPNVVGDMRSEVDVIAALAEAILPEGRFDWSEISSHDELRSAIAATVPGYAELAAGTKQEFQIPNRTFHEPSFATDSGRALAHVIPLPQPIAGAGEFALMTLRSEGQFNSVVYDEEDLYRGNTRRDVVMINAADAARLGVSEGDQVSVSSEIGSMNVRIAIVEISQGSAAMYYPEANAIVPRRIDPKSFTPAFKSVAVRINVAQR
ncbi:MAG: FdhF/YdeP family oxidoreductase [Candidatus Nanopelagicales bacterium]|nr:FdhF/YdeP family oxidoreductase [Candidatus Nanopelagicales bacterium]